MGKPRIMCVVGTRPDAIKTAPVVLELRKYADRVRTELVSTGQHREMLAQALNAFDLTPDYELGIMQHGQSLSQVASRALTGLDELFEAERPDLLLAQGDTSTTFIASLAAFYRHIQFGHVEAGLRTHTIHDPFPEEFNRRATALISTMHFAPTRWAVDNLRNEGIASDSIFLTGNTGIDAVKHVADRHQRKWYDGDPSRIVLLTAHRRENWGEPLNRIAEAAAEIVESFPNVRLVLPMHHNPTLRVSLTARLGDVERVDLIEPPDYPDFVKLMQRTSLILTDSGGVQEEAPAFGVPVLVLRETTERPEGVNAGCAKLIGTETQTIVDEASRLLEDEEQYRAMAHIESPYGDGRAAARIRYLALSKLGIESPPEPMWTSSRQSSSA